jgi:hypothetical protein
MDTDCSRGHADLLLLASTHTTDFLVSFHAVYTNQVAALLYCVECVRIAVGLA